MAVRGAVASDTGTDPGWMTDRLNLVRYRLRAARYGLKIRSRRSLLEFATLIGLPLAVIGLAPLIAGLVGWRETRGLTWLTSQSPLLLSVLVIAVVACGCWVIVRYLGNLSLIMHVAAATDAGASIVREDMDRGMRNPTAYSHLIRLYKPIVEETNAVLREHNYPYPFEFTAGGASPGANAQHEYASIALPASATTRIDNLLGLVAERQEKELQRFASTFAQARQRLIGAWRRLDGTTDVDDERGSNYTLHELCVENGDPEPRVRLHVGVASYGEIVRTCDALVNEFALFSYILGDRAGEQAQLRSASVLSCLPWRKQIHERASSGSALFLQPSNRAAGIGIAAATLFVARGRERYVSLGRRSDFVGTYPRALHVIPAGMCNTHQADYAGHRQSSRPRAADDSYLSTVIRSEFLEEWFDDEELASGRSTEWKRGVDRKWRSKVRQVEPVTLTGIAYDLLNLRPEICAVVIVKPFEGYLNFEYIRAPDVRITLQTTIDPTEIVQSGAAALLLANRYVGRR
jgi:hypothetical protein